MLTDDSVSTNILPGICKALEKFLIIYELDAITRMTSKKVLTIGSKMVGAAVLSGALAKTKKEGFDLLEQTLIKPNPQDEFDREQREANASQEEMKKRSKTAVKNVLDTMKGIKDLATSSLYMPFDSSLSLEPTYVTATTTLGTQLLGIKVIPVPVKSKEGYSLANYLTVDSSLNFMDTLILRLETKIIRGFWRLCRSLRIPYLKSRVISGDPQKDILWASTFHKRFVFCLLNYSDITGNEFFRNVGGVHKLHSLGWNSFVIADDVNKRAIFCMKQFHGLCSSVPYQMIYSSIGGEASKVYDKLEDIKKSASPFFKTSVNSKQIFGESKSLFDNYLNDYLNRIS